MTENHMNGNQRTFIHAIYGIALATSLLVNSIMITNSFTRRTAADEATITAAETAAKKADIDLNRQQTQDCLKDEGTPRMDDYGNYRECDYRK